MKRFGYFLLVAMIFLAGCEDVIDVETPGEPPRLVLDALIRVATSMDTIPVIVEARLTSNFFDENVPAQLSSIQIRNGSGALVSLTATSPGNGRYAADIATDFLQEGELTLEVEHEGESYTARTTFVPTVPFDAVTQGEGTLFAGDETEVNVRYTDPGERRDFYLFDFDFGEYLVSEDEFYQGQTFDFSYFYDSNLRVGQEVTISILGVDEEFFNYMNQLIAQSGSDTAGPFETPAGTVRGNIINNAALQGDREFADPGSYALGYFAVCQVFSETLVIEE